MSAYVHALQTGVWSVAVLTVLIAGCNAVQTPEDNEILPDDQGVFHVHPGDAIQPVLDQAARSKTRRVVIHEGTYRPQVPGQAFLVFNQMHNGLEVTARGEVILSAANSSLGDKDRESFPAVVNHIVYFGDGIDRSTLLAGVTLSGANGFIDPNPTRLQPMTDREELNEYGTFFYLDGGAIKIFGRSAPRIERVTFSDNRTLLCGAGVSVEQRGSAAVGPLFQDCVFQNNCCPGTGAAIDLLSGSMAEINNCLFVGNIANTGMEAITRDYGLTYKPEHGCGALTVFPQSRAVVARCTFTGNWNAVDDMGHGSVYIDSIFWQNTASDGSRPGKPYELDIADASGVVGCRIHGEINDLQKKIDPFKNHFDTPDPKFDGRFVPSDPAYEAVGFRPPTDNSSPSSTQGDLN